MGDPGLTLLIYAALGYLCGAFLFGFAGLTLAFLTALMWRAWGWFYYGWWWDMRYGNFSSVAGGLGWGVSCGTFAWFEEDGHWWRRTRWYERIIARWVNEKGSS